VKTILPPPGLENILEGEMLPDIQLGFEVFAAHWRKVNDSWSYPEHSHTMFELNIVIEGTQQMWVDGQNNTQHAGDLLFIRPGVLHYSEGSGTKSDMVYFCLHFDVDDLLLRRSLLSIANGVLTQQTAEERQLTQALQRFIVLSQQPEPNIQRARLLTMSAAFQLLAGLGAWAYSHDLTSGDLHHEASENTITIAMAIEKRLRHSMPDVPDSCERKGVEEIAAELGYSPAYCNRIFQKIYGVSPRQYLSGLITRQAKLLLMDHQLSVEDIARRLSYREVSQFSKQFKRWTGLSPVGYRRLSHSKEDH
jgi:AraC-like DNA-binding protein